jgi:predicted N-acetyltransferase YhbS
MKIENDHWLSEVLERNVFRVSLNGNVQDASAQNGFQKSGFYYAKIPVGRVSDLQILTDFKFYHVSIEVTLEKKLTGKTNENSNSMIVVRQVRSEDYKNVLDLASSSFTHTRFHTDPQIPPSLANKVKRCWAQSYLNGKRGEPLLVAEENGEVIGFLAALNTTINNQSIKVIDLICVSTKHQSKGVGRKLVDSFLSKSFGKCDASRVGTQLVNSRSLRLYQGKGFGVVDSAYVLHAHVS